MGRLKYPGGLWTGGLSNVDGAVTGRLLGGYWAVTGRLLGGYITGVVGHLGLFKQPKVAYDLYTYT